MVVANRNAKPERKTQCKFQVTKTKIKVTLPPKVFFRRVPHGKRYMRHMHQAKGKPNM
jgi:hypothetical protein